AHVIPDTGIRIDSVRPSPLRSTSFSIVLLIFDSFIPASPNTAGLNWGTRTRTETERKQHGIIRRGESDLVRRAGLQLPFLTTQIQPDSAMQPLRATRDRSVFFRPIRQIRLPIVPTRLGAAPQKCKQTGSPIQSSATSAPW